MCRWAKACIASTTCCRLRAFSASRRSRRSSARARRRGRICCPARPYAVIHAAPMFRYKQWHAEGWRAVASHLAGAGPCDRCDRRARRRGAALSRRDLARHRCASARRQADLAGTRPRRSPARASFIGPDTSVTHLAAAAGCPTVALYGPTDPRLWGPWPAKGLAAPWDAAATIQQRGNVWLVQNPLPCQPCQHEGLPAPSAKLQPLPRRARRRSR